jgi:hypothetical protein
MSAETGVLREAGDELVVLEHGRLEPGLVDGSQGAGDDVAVAGSDHDATRLTQQGLSGALAQVVPEVAGAGRDRGEPRVLHAGDAEQPGRTVGRAHRVTDAEALDADHALPALGQPPECLGSPGAETDDDDVGVEGRVEGSGCRGGAGGVVHGACLSSRRLRSQIPKRDDLIPAAYET